MKISNLIQFYNLSKCYKEITYMVKIEIFEKDKCVNKLYIYIESMSPSLFQVRFVALHDEKLLKYFYKLKNVHFDDFMLAKEYAVKKMQKIKQYLENSKNN